MESYAARLASFNAAHPPTRKRASSASSGKTLKWPHKHPSPPQARHGFSEFGKLNADRYLACTRGFLLPTNVLVSG